MNNNKFDRLKDYLSTLKKQGICLAFSGGIDSALLLLLCKDLNVTALTFVSEFQTEEEVEFTQHFCEKSGIKHVIISLNMLDDEIIATNPKDRCYHCKKKFFTEIKNYASAHNIKNILDGTNYDDLHTYRPGLKAIKELGIISPFAKFEITKDEIRSYAKSIGLEIYNKPSTPCLATRFPYGAHLSTSMIEQVKSAENILARSGFVENRVRLHGDVARIELPVNRFEDFISQRENLTKELKTIGFRYITLDIEGLRRGSMDL